MRSVSVPQKVAHELNSEVSFLSKLTHNTKTRIITFTDNLIYYYLSFDFF